MEREPEALLETWFGPDLDSPEAVDERFRTWFGGGPDFDALLRERYGDWPDVALRGGLDGWRETARGMLALVLCLDQLPRNLYRGDARAFAGDEAALALARRAIERGDVARLHPIEAIFLHLPLEHAEDARAQRQCVEGFGALRDGASRTLRPALERALDFAGRHQIVIDRFGRFPHRNAALGRTSTAEELRYLEQGGETFS